MAAREAVAACQEAAAIAAPRAAAGSPPVAKPATGGTAEPQDGADGRRRRPMGSRAGEDAAIIRLLRGDREALQPARRLASPATTPTNGAAGRSRSADCSRPLIARSIEASAFDFPTDHPFWGPFTRSQCRDIAAAPVVARLPARRLRRRGPTTGSPSQRDLSLAVGYAGLDPMRIRHWPSEAEMADLLREVTVAADEYVWEAAGGLTLGELVSLLGRRADGLTELWNEWGIVRPILLAAD